MKSQLNRKEYFVEILKKQINNNKENILKQWNNPVDTKTRHFFIDDLLPKTDVDEIYKAFPRNGEGFFDRESFREKKKTSANLNSFDPILRDITYAFQDHNVVKLIADILGLEKIDPDPKLYAGGLSMMFPGDFLNPHIDNSHDADRNRFRRLNLLFYVSPDWADECGGNFELWNEDRSLPHTIVSYQNRLVVMETHKNSWHSVNVVKADRPRCCVSNYYFSEISPDGTDYFHVTSFLGRPEQPLRRILGFVDNKLRNIASNTLKIGRGKDQINKDI